MGSDSSSQIPIIDFSTMSPKTDRGTATWLHLCKMVREAGENYGCFEVIYDKISPELQAETFSVAKELFARPSEAKEKNVNPKPYHGYYGGSFDAVYESFGLEDASNLDSVKSFIQLMWPDGNDPFSQTICTMVKQMEELSKTIEMSIIDSYGLGKELGSSVVPCKTLLRIMTYEAPPNGEHMYGLDAHTDKLMYALLGADQVFGLEVEAKDGRWIQLTPPPNSLIFMVGDPLMAWSNGRLHAARHIHKVMMEELHKQKYSWVAFQVPVKGTIMEPHQELVDEQHPKIFKEFDFRDFMDFSCTMEGMAIESSTQVFAFAGI